MSDRYSFTGAPVTQPSDPRYTVYDARYMMRGSSILGPQNHMDGVAFWYRPEDSEFVADGTEEMHARQDGQLGTEHVKHRRTRSGCFTCRSRRVKCDEARPVCDRCKKGNRECEFPQPTSSSKSAGRTKAAANRVPSHNEDTSSDESGEKKGLETIKDEDEDKEVNTRSVFTKSRGKARKQSLQSAGRKQKHGHQSEFPVQSKDKARSPSTDSSSSMSGSQTPASSLFTQPSSTTASHPPVRWLHLKPDMQLYLDFYHDHITNWHYLLKTDSQHFLNTTFIDLALGFEPLLYAVVGFSAYHHTLRRSDGKLSHFLKYYSRSLSLLMKTLDRGQPPTEATILTILQLASFEERLGDWPNVIAHHRAARQMFLKKYKPADLPESYVSRQIFQWIARFDILGSLMAGSEPMFSRDWYAVNARWYEDQIDPGDIDIDNTLHYVGAGLKLVCVDLAFLGPKLQRGDITMSHFINENEAVAKRLDGLRTKIESLNDDYYTVKEFPERRPPEIDDIVDPYVPGGLYHGPLFFLNLTWLDWYATEQMQIYQISIVKGQPPPPELERLSLEQCRIYETIDRWPHSPEGTIHGAIACLGLSVVFLPRDQRHTMWCRKKLAAVEQRGFVYPTAFRSKMAEMWHLPEVNHWWLPDDEGFTPLLREIRAFIKERGIVYRNSKGDDLRDDLRDMKAIFSRLDIDDSPRSSPSGGSGGANTERSP